MKDVAFDFVWAMKGPIITCDASWAASIPERIKRIVPESRLIALLEGKELAPYTEALMWLMTRSLQGPMDSEWTDIYTHVSCTVLEQFYKEDHWDSVQAPRKLSSWMQSQLDDLRRKIYNKSRELLQKKMNEERKKTKAAV